MEHETRILGAFLDALWAAKERVVGVGEGKRWLRQLVLVDRPSRHTIPNGSGRAEHEGVRSKRLDTYGLLLEPWREKCDVVELRSGE